MENRGMNVFMVLALVAFAQRSLAETNTPVSQIVSSTTNGVPLETPKTVINSPDKPIDIKLYYESLCSDSIDFVKNQFTPVYDKLSKFISVQFIPFSQGNFTNITDPATDIQCKREKECDADIIHACGIDKIKEQNVLVKFVNCSLVEAPKNNNTIPLETCIKNSGIDNDTLELIKTCIKDKTEYNSLLKNCFNMARKAEVKTVPKIVLNKIAIDEKLSASNFMNVVCNAFLSNDKPAECNTIINGSNTVVVGILPILAGLYYFINLF